MLFLIEPVAGKRLLPLLGGSAAVWTACLVFFQCALLLGYLGAHWLVTLTRPRVQSATYLGLLALSLVQLVLAIDPRLHAAPAHPITSVLWLLTILIGLPFVTLAASSPLLQAWYARSWLEDIAEDVSTTEGATREHAQAQPYRLYAVSNVGSLFLVMVVERGHETAVRRALGASTLDIVQLLMRRSLSIARCLAVPMSHAPGLSGTPA